MTLDLEAIEWMARRASDEPWEWRWDAIIGQWSLGPGVLLADGTDGTPGGDEIDYYNAEFIAHARTDIPALCKEVRRLREENAALREAINNPTTEQEPT